MLQYPVQLPPLSLSSSPKSANKDNDYFRPNDPRFPPNPLTKRLNKDSLVNRSAISPLALSANHASSPADSSSPSTNSIKLPRSPYISSRPLSMSIPVPSAKAQNGPTMSQASSASSTIEDVLAPGDIVGEGCSLQGESIRLVSISSRRETDHDDLDCGEPATEFEVVRRLGSGSYAVVYLVKEVLSRSLPSEDGHMSTIGSMEFDGNLPRRPETVYGREYAIKCLSKANLDADALDAQLTEVTIHQSLHSHPNIVTLHRTLETSSFLLLLLEFVPGEDLFYFLEQARDHYELDNRPSDAVSVSRTPPTPSLLSNLHPSQLLARTRLRLIASMFAQMCDAVASCHAQQVFHRDIKPENFIVTDGFISLPDGRQERKVIVKLTDFGLSTMDVESSDMDCGSAPYMSYECRNNVAPTYRPRAADVWSLGIVLINMLYHFNPWTDTSQGACPSFDLYRRDPVNFFMYRFTGMTRPVAEFLANRVFCILDDPGDDSPRVTASEFGMWIKNLPTLLGGGHGMYRTLSNSSTQGHPIALSTPLSHRPTSRNPSVSARASLTPALVARSLSRAPSLGPAYEREEPSELSTVYDHQEDEEQSQEPEPEPEPVQEETRPQQEHGDDDPVSIRTTSTKRRKRGLRKGKGASTATPTTTTDETLITLTIASQALAREISKASRASSNKSASTKASITSSARSRGGPYEPVSVFAMPAHLCSSNKATPPTTSPVPPLPSSSTASTISAPVKKPSKWKLSFGKQNAGVSTTSTASALEDAAPPSPLDLGSSPQPMSTTASNVTSLIMGLNAPPPSMTPSVLPPPPNPVDDRSSTWTRGRRGRGSPPPNKSTNKSFGYPSYALGKGPQSSASSTHSAYPTLPKNIKIMSGVPWELDQLPRGQYPNNPVGDIFGLPPQQRKQRTRKTKDPKLDTINERPGQHGGVSRAPENLRRDASTSTTDLAGNVKEEGSENVKKVQRGQINALAKMLSALRRP
ncbi:Negative regulator of sexual conjugation and meiosis [Leucoagaricus sp. SymC.cos]|nr:Negative regulator of sexual conjugation and meiosis [Leucoagaricus sp. SymC.cos]